MSLVIKKFKCLITIDIPLFFIPQLTVVPEHNIFLGLSDGVVFYAHLEYFIILGYLSQSKGASYLQWTGRSSRHMMWDVRAN